MTKDADRVDSNSSQGSRNPDPFGSDIQAIIAIPARNEKDHLPMCLTALAAQERGAPAFAVVVFANNCDDDTANSARSMQLNLPFRLVVHEAELPEGCRTAGHARRGAMDLAHELAGSSDILLLSTDADARPRPDWLANMLRHIAAGADAVAGRAIMTEEEASTLPGPLRYRLRREALLARLSDRIAAAIDDLPWDPWPRHCGHWGANFAVRADLYAHCGGVPQVPLAEDRAFFALLERNNARIRHAEDCIVEVSARLDGRAPGGMADVLDRRAHGEDPLCDAVIEPISRVIRRYRLRRALRNGPEAAHRARIARKLGVELAVLQQVIDGAPIGQAWGSFLAIAPALQEVRVLHTDLERQIAAAIRVIRALCPGENMPEASPEETLV